MGGPLCSFGFSTGGSFPSLSRVGAVGRVGAIDYRLTQHAYQQLCISVFYTTVFYSTHIDINYPKPTDPYLDKGKVPTQEAKIVPFLGFCLVLSPAGVWVRSTPWVLLNFWF